MARKRRDVRRPDPHPSGARPPAVPADLVPKHVAIVMDGNGRWAKQRGLPRTAGHERGEHSLFDVVEGAIEIGVKAVSAYAFSTENWTRSPDEVRFLMGFNRDVIRRRRDQLVELGVRVVWSGRPGRLWKSVISELQTAVVDAELQGQRPVGQGHLLGFLQFLDDALPQPPGTAGPAHPDPHGVQLVAAAADDVPVEAHQEAHLVRAALPVLGGEGVGRQPTHPDVDAAAGHVHQRRLAAPVALDPRQAPGVGPAAVAVHDDGDVPGDQVARDRRRQRA